MVLVIQTQYRENYAAHQGFTGEYYWKNKGGDSVKVLNVPTDANLEEIVEVLRGELEQSNDYVQEYIIGYGLEEDGWLSDFETSQLEYEGEITYKEPTYQYADLPFLKSIKEYEDREYAENLSCEGY